MADEVVQDMYHMYGMFRNITDNLLMSEAEVGPSFKETFLLFYLTYTGQTRMITDLGLHIHSQSIAL